MSVDGDKRRQAILRFVARFQKLNGISPSIREIGLGVGLSHPSAIKYHLDRLEKDGEILHFPGIPRSYVIP